MDEYTVKDIKKFQRAAQKYPPGHPLRLAWYGFKSEETAALYEGFSELIPNHIESILDVGCGTGELALLIHEKYPWIEYYGFDIIPENVEHVRKILPDVPKENIWVDNYWNVMTRKERNWDFILSNSVLFSCTDLKYRPLLFDLLDAVAPKGFLIGSLRGDNERGGLRKETLSNKMKASIDNSIDLVKYYYEGKRDFLPSAVMKWHYVFFIYRNGTKAIMPEIPDELLDLDHPDKIAPIPKRKGFIY